MSESSPSQPIKVYSSPLSGHAHCVRLMLSLLDLPTEVIEAELSTKAFAAGDQPTIADVAAYSYVLLAPEGDEKD